jgi:hypothetical protein
LAFSLEVQNFECTYFPAILGVKTSLPGSATLYLKAPMSWLSISSQRG